MLVANPLSFHSGKQKNPARCDVIYDRVAAERTQVYDRLSLSPPDVIGKIFSQFSIPLSEKKRKVYITEELCKSARYTFSSSSRGVL
jgi:hypothetical protein